MVTYASPATFPGPGLFPIAPFDGTVGTYAPTVTGFLDWNPTPRVTIEFDTLDPNCHTITIWRQATARQMPVRGAVNMVVSGGAAAVDLDAPSGIPLIYVGQMFDADGVFIGYTGTGQITIYSPDTIVQNPFQPSAAIRVKVGIDTGKTVQLGTTLTAVYPAGRRAGIGVGGQRFGIPNVPVYLYGDTLEQADALDDMFGTRNGDLGLPPFLVVRFAAKYARRLLLPQPLILGVPAPTRTLINVTGGGTRTGWDVSGPELDPPAAALAEAVYTRDDIDAGFTTRDDLDAAYGTRNQVDIDYSRAAVPPDTGTTPSDPTTGTDDTYGAGSYGDGPYGA